MRTTDWGQHIRWSNKTGTPSGFQDIWEDMENRMGSSQERMVINLSPLCAAIARLKRSLSGSMMDFHQVTASLRKTNDAYHRLLGAGN